MSERPVTEFIARTVEILDDYAPYRFTDEELSEVVYWSVAGWDACRARIDALGLPKSDPLRPIPVEYVAWDASQILCDIMPPIIISVRSTGRVLK